MSWLPPSSPKWSLCCVLWVLSLNMNSWIWIDSIAFDPLRFLLSSLSRLTLLSLAAKAPPSWFPGLSATPLGVSECFLASLHGEIFHTHLVSFSLTLGTTYFSKGTLSFLNDCLLTKPTHPQPFLIVQHKLESKVLSSNREGINISAQNTLLTAELQATL